jgi:DNA-binding CsgD family transcriptional regulator
MRPVRSAGTSGPTNRETEVLRLICDGLSTKEVAGALGIAFKTVVAHRANLMTKSGAKNVVQLVKWALKNGLVSF